ncbi:hypothetical protein BGZ94_008092 [Podila epigama]|nr:hypothetical protein BGZ94_008092 [Podila epigama]
MDALLVSLRISRLWWSTGHPLIWRAVRWENTSQSCPETLAALHQTMLLHAHRIRTLYCTFHYQSEISHVDTSALLNSFLSTTTNATGLLDDKDAVKTRDSDNDVRPNSVDYQPSIKPWSKKQLKQLFLKGYFDLQLSSLVSQPSETTTALPRFFSFDIPTLTRLEIHALNSTPIDLHLILDSALRLEHLSVDSHGSFLDSQGFAVLANRTIENHNTNSNSRNISSNKRTKHAHLASLKIQHLKISQQELFSVGERCPNLVELHSLSSPGHLWKLRPSTDIPPVATQSLAGVQPAPHLFSQEHQHHASEMSLVRKLARTCPRLRKLHVGLQQGGFHLDSILEALTLFPNLTWIGLPALDCTKRTMDIFKRVQSHQQESLDDFKLPSSSIASPYNHNLATGTANHRTSTATTATSSLSPIPLSAHMRPTAFLTKLSIMNVSSSERISLALHEYLCWTPYLKELYALNTTLYLEQVQSGKTITVVNDQQHQQVVSPPTVSPTVRCNRTNITTTSTTTIIINGSGSCSNDTRRSHTPEQSDHPFIDTDRGSPVSPPLSPLSPLSPSLSPLSPSLSPLSLSPLLPHSHEQVPGPARQQHLHQQEYQSCKEQQSARKWACTELETLVIRFARIPRRHHSEFPQRSKDTFGFMSRLQKLKRLCIKEGLMLEEGREYDALQAMTSLEHVVFTTCYPIPIRPADMEAWLPKSMNTMCTDNTGRSAGEPQPSTTNVRKVVIRRQKQNPELDQAMEAWFRVHHPQIKFLFELTDCSEEEFSF